jgi:hypothetical protein
MHLLILTAVKILKIPVLVRTMFRRIIPACVIRNWSVVGPSTKQLVMEHELFRHVELELFVQRSQLQAALRFLKETLTVAGHRDASLGHELKSQIEKAQCAEQITNVRGVYCHHYPICVRKIQPDDTLISMASNAGTQTASSPQSVSPQPDECWYSITLTNYHLGAARQPFENLARFLAVSMSRLFGARPHWGKLCPLHPTELRTLYPAFSIFRDQCERADPAGVFRNEWTDKLLAVGDTASHQISEETFQKTDSTLESR